MRFPQWLKSLCCCYQYEKIKEKERARDILIKEMFNHNCTCSVASPCHYCYRFGAERSQLGYAPETGARLGKMF